MKKNEKMNGGGWRLEIGGKIVQKTSAFYFLNAGLPDEDP